MPLHVSRHPLVADSLAGLRDRATDPEQFRVLARNVITLLLYEATSDLPVKPGKVTTPLREADALMMEDEHGPDEKIIAVPVDALHPYYSGVQSYRDLPQILRDQIAHFFQHYKDLERGKWVNIARWADAEEAAGMITAAIARAGS